MAAEAELHPQRLETDQPTNSSNNFHFIEPTISPNQQQLTPNSPHL